MAVTISLNVDWDAQIADAKVKCTQHEEISCAAVTLLIHLNPNPHPDHTMTMVLHSKKITAGATTCHYRIDLPLLDTDGKQYKFRAFVDYHQYQQSNLEGPFP